MTADVQFSDRFAPALIGGEWRRGSSRQGPVINPACGRIIGHHAVVEEGDIRSAIDHARQAFGRWRQASSATRSDILIRAASLLVERKEEIARTLSGEQGKPLAEALGEVARAADIVAWYGQEARRIYGRLLPSADAAVRLVVEKEPIGPVAGFTPWNFPLSQSARKVAAALAAGCTVILKGSEEAPFCCVAFAQAFIDAGTPAGVIQLLFGDPAQISAVLVSDPAIRKISFTGSVPVGRHLAAAAGQHLKYATMELGGHAPALVFADVPLNDTVRSLVFGKYRNAGQVCVSPTRILVENPIFNDFVSLFGDLAAGLTVGDPFEPGTTMGPLVHARRVGFMEELVSDALDKGATLVVGGKRIDGEGCFFAPTVLANVPVSARVMNEEPFGPVAIVNAFDDEAAALAEANRLPFGLAAYLYTRSGVRIRRLSAQLEAGMVSVNGQPVGLPEAPFGGVKDSGFGREGGIEGLDEYLVTKFVAERTW